MAPKIGLDEAVGDKAGIFSGYSVRLEYRGDEQAQGGGVDRL
jgi:hypothetical protein